MILVASAMLAGAPLSIMAYSNDNGSPDKKIEKRIEHLKSKLSLTDDQVAKVKAVYMQNETLLTNDHNAVKAAAKESDAKKAAWQKMKAYMQQVEAQVMPILTADQQTKLKEMIAKHEKEHDKD